MIAVACVYSTWRPHERDSISWPSDGSKFSQSHVIRLEHMVRRHSTVPYKFIVLSNDPTLPSYLNVVPLMHRWPSWWCKIELFAPSNFNRFSRIIYFDLDTIILGNIDPLLSSSENILVIRDFYTQQMSTGVLAWNRGALDVLHTEFLGREMEVTLTHVGDQDWLRDCVPTHCVRYIQDVQPGTYSYKVHCSTGHPPLNAKIVCFHGSPFIQDVKDPWVIKEWR